MIILNHLDPIYTYLPYCAHVEIETNPQTKQKVIKTTLLRTYPAYPWHMDTGSHLNDDPIEFINACARNGLVHWETEEQKKVRLSRNGKN